MKLNRVISALFTCLVAFSAAAYDPAPDENLAVAQGEWRGDLTYNDYSNPGSLVSIPATMFVALRTPSTLVLQLTFDDGPGKTIYSYEEMAFDFAANSVSWTSGIDEPTVLTATIESNSLQDGVRTIVMSRASEKNSVRYTLRLSARKFSLVTNELSDTGEITFRNEYRLARP